MTTSGGEGPARNATVAATAGFGCCLSLQKGTSAGGSDTFQQLLRQQVLAVCRCKKGWTLGTSSGGEGPSEMQQLLPQQVLAVCRCKKGWTLGTTSGGEGPVAI